MSATYNYLVSLIKEPETQAAKSPASSSGTFDYLKSLIKPGADNIWKPNPRNTITPPKDAISAYNYQLINDAIKSQPAVNSEVRDAQPTDNSDSRATREDIVESNDAGTAYAKQLVANHQRDQVNSILRDPVQSDVLYAAVLGVPYTAPTQESLQKLNEQQNRAATLFGFESPQVSALITRKNDLQSSMKHVEDVYMTRPAELTPSEQQARRLQQYVASSSGIQKQQFQKQYDSLVNSDQYVTDNWDHWLELAQTGRKLTTDEKKEAKEALAALDAALERDGLYNPVPDTTDLALQGGNAGNAIWNDDIKNKRIKYLSLSGALASKVEGVSAVGLGAASSLPFAESISKWLGKKSAESVNDGDQKFRDFMATADPFANAQQAHPGLYLTGNIVGNVAMMAAGGEALKGLGIASKAAKEAILFGTMGAASSAENQDWSKPGKAIFNTVIDGGISILSGYVGGKAASETMFKVEQILKNSALSASAKAAITNGAGGLMFGVGQTLSQETVNYAKARLEGSDYYFDPVNSAINIVIGGIFGTLETMKGNYKKGSAEYAKAEKIQNELKSGEPAAKKQAVEFLNREAEKHQPFSSKIHEEALSPSITTQPISDNPLIRAALPQSAGPEIQTPESTLTGKAQNSIEETAGAHISQWPGQGGETNLARGGGEGYNGSRGKSSNANAFGAEDNPYSAYLKMLDDLEAARKSGMTARDYAKSKGVPSILTDKEAALLDEYNARMSSESTGNETKTNKLDDLSKEINETWNEDRTAGLNPTEGAGEFGNIADDGNITRFTYQHNPSNNPKVLADAVEDSKAVYGYRPNTEGSLKAFADGDWSNPDYVKKARQKRINYHEKNEAGILELITSMRNQGYSDEQIVRAVVDLRNQSRLSSYLDAKGNIIDHDGYAQALAHCKTYEQLRAEGKTNEDIIKSATRGNPGMDASTGLYDDYYDQYSGEK